MRSITLKELKLRNYVGKGITYYKIADGICIKCGNDIEYSNVGVFLRNRIPQPEKKDLWDTCSRCWHLARTTQCERWRQNNREIQLIIQNTPEQKRKNAAGVSKSWSAERRRKASDFQKERMTKGGKLYNETIARLREHNNNPNNPRPSKYFGSGGLKGRYKDMNYDSALELSFIFWCEEHAIPLKRYDLLPIQYIGEDGREHFYFPDFIMGNDTIVEIKGYGLYYNRNYQRNILKLESLKKWTEENNFNFRYILSNDKILTKNYMRARNYHYADYKKELSTV